MARVRITGLTSSLAAVPGRISPPTSSRARRCVRIDVAPSRQSVWPINLHPSPRLRSSAALAQRPADVANARFLAAVAKGPPSPFFVATRPSDDGPRLPSGRRSGVTLLANNSEAGQWSWRHLNPGSPEGLTSQPQRREAASILHFCPLEAEPLDLEAALDDPSGNIGSVPGSSSSASSRASARASSSRSVRKAVSPRSISSHESASATKSSPAPPYSSGIRSRATRAPPCPR
jgi:hypothetical protein